MSLVGKITKKSFSVFCIVAILFICFFSLYAEGNVHDFTTKTKSFFSKLFDFPVFLWVEFIALKESVQMLGMISRFESMYYQEHKRFVSDGLGYWGKPFGALLIDPNYEPDKKKWYYRVEASNDQFKVIARRKRGRFKDREVWFDNKGEWSGNYPFWPLKDFSFLRDYFAGSQSTMKEVNKKAIRKVIDRGGEVKFVYP